MKFSELLRTYQIWIDALKLTLTPLFHSKTGNLIRGKEYSKSLDEDVITRPDEAKKQ